MCRKTSCGGSPADLSAKNDLCSRSQEVPVMNEQTNPETPNKGSIEDSTVALYAKEESGKEFAQATATVRDGVENVKPETTDTLAPEVLFDVMLTKVAFSLSLHTRYESAVE